MRKTDIKQMPEYFDKYINLVEDSDIMEALESSIEALTQQDIQMLQMVADKTYAPGKWTIKEIIQHLSDWERIFCFRTLIFVRNEEAYPQGFDENHLSLHSKANNKELTTLIDELISIRKATIAMFRSFDEEDFDKIIVTYNNRISVLAMGYFLIGHQIHHLNIIKNQYLPLANK